MVPGVCHTTSNSDTEVTGLQKNLFQALAAIQDRDCLGSLMGAHFFRICKEKLVFFAAREGLDVARGESSVVSQTVSAVISWLRVIVMSSSCVLERTREFTSQKMETGTTVLSWEVCAVNGENDSSGPSVAFYYLRCLLYW